jgi:hypothetical protein
MLLRTPFPARGSDCLTARATERLDPIFWRYDFARRERSQTNSGSANTVNDPVDFCRSANQDCKRQEYLVRFRRGAQHNIRTLQVTKLDLQ